MLKIIDDERETPRAVYSALVDVRWSDLDADGHVNNVAVLRLVEEARMRWANALELGRCSPGLLSVVAGLACEYRAPILYPASVRVDIGCSHLGNSSIGLAFELIDAGDETLRYARACMTWVWVDAGTRRPTLMPPLLRQACSQPDPL